MTPEQKKELEELNEAITHDFKDISCSDKDDEVIALFYKYAKLYADHFEQIQALKSGEWVLVPAEPTEKMVLASQVYVHSFDVKLIHKAMIAARPKLGENDDE